MKDNSKILKNLGVSVFGLIVVCAVYIFFFLRFEKNVDVLSDILAEINVMNETTVNSSKTGSMIVSLKEDINIVNRYFVNQKNVVSFIENLEGISKKVKVDFKLGAVSVEEYKFSGNKTESFLSLQINAFGQFKDLFVFIKALETLPVKMRLGNIRVSLVDTKIIGEQNLGPWKAEINMEVLSFIK